MGTGVNTEGRNVPVNPEAEMSVLGAMLQDNKAVLTACEQLHEDDFLDPRHREIFGCMAELNRDQSPVDLITVDDLLNRRGTSAGTGGTSYLLQLMNYVPTTANVRSYIHIVQENSTLRKLIGACQDIIGQCCKRDAPVSEILSGADKAISDIVADRIGTKSLVQIGEVLVDTYEHIETLSRNKGRLSGIPTGFIDLDHMLSGLHPGELIIVGARPSMGKTAFAMNIAAHASLSAGKSVAVFSLEMSAEAIAMRMLCSEAKVDMKKIMNGSLGDKDWMALANALVPLAAADLFIDDTPALTPAQIRSRCRKLMMSRPLDMIVIDYLTKMTSDVKKDSYNLEVGQITKDLTALAKELKIPVVCCAQLNRVNTDRSDKRPMLSDLRDSGSIEQDADVVMFIHRQEYYTHDPQDKGIGEVIVAKQRNGETGPVKLAWLPEYTTFANLARDPADGGWR